MKIKLSGAGKRFNRDWIFRKATLEFGSAGSYAITGPNGSGKSTLLQSLAGLLQVSEGSISYISNDTVLPDEEVYRFISFCAPYIEVVEEMNLTELLAFHQVFKPFHSFLTPEKIIDFIGLTGAAAKQIRHFSSGMKQRVKLGQAIFSDTPVILLDEPCTNLDAGGIALYHSLMNEYCSNRLVIVSSNDEVEYRFCKERIDITRFKPN
jgi:ABC-type multidrug transport system ATPase subunit